VRQAVQKLMEEGLEVLLDGDELVVRAPCPLDERLLRLLREHKAEFVTALKGAQQRSAQSETPTSACASCARVHMCISCAQFEPRESGRPDGWCKQFHTETWSKMPVGRRYVVGRQ
jgi:hypothetical protein